MTFGHFIGEGNLSKTPEPIGISVNSSHLLSWDVLLIAIDFSRMAAFAKCSQHFTCPPEVSFRKRLIKTATRSVRPLVARPGSLPEPARGEDWIIDIRFRTKGLLQAGCAKVMETLQKDFNWGYFAMRRAERLGGPNHIIKRQKPYRTVNRTR